MNIYLLSSSVPGQKRKHRDDDVDPAPAAKRFRSFVAFEQRMFGVLQRLKSPVMAGGNGGGGGYSSYGGSRQAFGHYLKHFKSGLSEAKTFLKFYSSQE